jgi:hypothetical protein
MGADAQTLWLAAAVDALTDIRASEVEAVSAEVRRSVTRPGQIVPEIARLVGERRARESRMRELSRPALEAPRRIPVMDRRGQPMSEDDTAELNAILERLGATARYCKDGSRYMIEKPQSTN